MNQRQTRFAVASRRTGVYSLPLTPQPPLPVNSEHKSKRQTFLVRIHGERGSNCFRDGLCHNLQVLQALRSREFAGA